MLPVPNPAIIFQRIDDGAVLFSPTTETYFGLNDVGAKIWELLPPTCASLDDLCAELAAVYPDAPRSDLQDDVQGLLADLLREGLVTLTANAGRSGDPAS